MKSAGISALVATGRVVVSEQDIARQAENSPPTKNWVLYTRTPASVGAFVGGPSAPPSGMGSLHLATPTGADKVFLFNFDHVGTELASITAMSYSTYRNSGDASQLPALNIQVDYNGPAVAGGFTTLVFEPVYNTAQATVAEGSWQNWNAIGSGRWWSTKAIPGACAFDCFVSWSDIVAANPTATVLGGFGVNQGSGNPALDANVDELTIAYGGNSTTYDFEHDALLGPCDVTADVSTKTLTLNSNCVTSYTLLITNGWTLDGNGYSITGVDPAGGHFLGAVVKNGGAVANVMNLTVTVAGLANVCDGGDARLRGIMFDGASGAIRDSRVIGINQGASGCQEGNAIEVRNAPFDATGPDVNVVISGNTVNGYQKTGIVANGSVAATITGNIVSGAGPVSYIAQNGIQIGYGATAMLRGNVVSGNYYTPVDTEACGLLYYEAAGVNASQNKMSRNEENFCNYGKGGGSFSGSPAL